MKLVYVKWKDVQKLIKDLKEPESSEFELSICTKWLSDDKCWGGGAGKWVYEVELPEEMIT